MKPNIKKYKEPEYNKDLQYCIIVDIDGTVAHMKNRSPYDYSKVDSDIPDIAILSLIKSFLEGYGEKVHLFFVSGRKDECRSMTEDWLKNNAPEYDALYMRGEGDKRKDVEVKKDLFNEHINGKYNVLFVLDDRNQTVEGWRDLGLKCLQVAYGDF